MQKQQSFYVLKFSSSRLKNSNNRINITLDEARKNNECVKITENQLIRSLKRIQNNTFDKNKLNEIILLKKKLSKNSSTNETREQIKKLNKQIDEMLFISDVVFVVFDNVAHYNNIQKNGLFLGGERFSRMLTSSGNLRKNTTLFIKDKYKEKLTNILDNDRDKSVLLNGGKYNTYMGLANSNSMVVDFPEKMVVVKDYEFKRFAKVDWVENYGKNLSAEEIEKEIIMNPFDGAGLISPQLAKQWATNLDIEYLPAWFIVRCNFMKGLVLTFNFHEFAKYVAHKSEITDIYGEKININDISLIISESQFKLWNSFKDTKTYIESCKSNFLDFGITRVSPPKDKNYVFGNYQFLQVLYNITDNDIKKMCLNSVNHIKNILNNNSKKLLYLLGNTTNMIENNNWFQNIQDPIIKSLFFTNFSDDYINQNFLRTLNKTIRSMFLGRLLFKGNFSAILPDPYAFCEHVFGMEVKGLLPEGYFYSNFWNNNNINKIACARSPLTISSEINVVNLKNDDNLKLWYKYLYSGIVLPVSGIDVLLGADEDFDGDLNFTTNDINFINGSTGGIPVAYEKKSIEKKILTDDDLFQSDRLGFNSHIGYITNVSSFLHSLLFNYPNDSKEYLEIERRLKSLRKFQGSEIDKIKGNLSDPFPEYYGKYQRIDYSLSEEEIEQIKFDNSLVAKRRPEFFIWLYPHLYRRHKKELDNMDFISQIKFGKPFEELLHNNNRTEDEEKLIERYYHTSFFLHNDSVMNKISRYMQSQIAEIKQDIKNIQFDPTIYLDKTISIDNNKLNQLKKLYQEYNSFKRTTKENSYDNEESFDNISQFADYIQNKALSEISSNIQELASLAVKLTYIDLKSGNKEFSWKCFGDGIILNLIQNYNKDYIECPVPDNNGDIEYLFSKYKNKKFLLSEIL